MSTVTRSKTPTRAPKKKNADKRTAHYVLSTHWDREWYQNFQDYRNRLVRLFDNILKGMDTGELRGPFQTDGQAIILDDYLEVRPEKRALVEQRAKEGKLVIGPWYVLPDEFLVSGESIIRNIRMGRQIARDYGSEPSKAGFACDLFGQISQLPQLFAGFGIPGGFIWRGMNMLGKRHVLWTGADGTELPCYRFGITGYCTYAFLVRRSADKELYDFDPVKHPKFLSDFVELESSETEVDPILLFDGGDHLEWDPQDYKVLMQAAENASLHCEIVHSSLDQYLDDMLAHKDKITTRYEGEMREPGLHQADQDFQWVIPGVLSSRVWIKQSNAECENLLTRWAEPFNTLASHLLKRDYPTGFFDVAWKWLIKNHPHDSICGCSIDDVHEAMKFRFMQSKQIAERQTTDALMAIGAQIKGDVPDNEVRVVLFNPAPQPFEETTELLLEVPKEWGNFNEFFGYEPKPAFRLYDAAGKEVPYQRIAQRKDRARYRTWPTRFSAGWDITEVRVSLPVSIPALGYTTLTLREGEKTKDNPPFHAAALTTRHPNTPGMATSERSMENEHIRVVIQSNGSLTLTDKRSGQTYERLMTYEDIADNGDGWFHGPIVNDQAFTSTASAAEVALVHDGPMLTTFRVRTTFRVPKRLDRKDNTRSAEMADLIIDSRISLRPGSDRLEVETTIDNNVEDHRLRVLLPSGAKTDTYISDTPFDVVERKIALREDNHVYRELETEAKPQQGFTAVFDKSRGLAVVSTGLYETAIRDQAERTLALTLLRGVTRTPFTHGEPNGQVLGKHTFRYWIVPLTGEPDRAKLFAYAGQVAAGVRAVYIRKDDIKRHREFGAELGTTGSLLSVDSPLVLTSIRRVGEATEVRVFNPTNKPAKACIRAMERVRSASLVDLESRPQGEKGVKMGKNSNIELTVAPKQIRTLSLLLG